MHNRPTAEVHQGQPINLNQYKQKFINMRSIPITITNQREESPDENQNSFDLLPPKKVVGKTYGSRRNTNETKKNGNAFSKKTVIKVKRNSH